MERYRVVRQKVTMWQTAIGCQAVQIPWSKNVFYLCQYSSVFKWIPRDLDKRISAHLLPSQRSHCCCFFLAPLLFISLSSTLFHTPHQLLSIPFQRDVQIFSTTRCSVLSVDRWNSIYSSHSKFSLLIWNMLHFWGRVEEETIPSCGTLVGSQLRRWLGRQYLLRLFVYFWGRRLNLNRVSRIA